MMIRTAEARYEAVQRLLASSEPIMTCGHALGSDAFVVAHGTPSRVQCWRCWQDAVGLIKPVIRCDVCEQLVGNCDVGWWAELDIERPLPALPGWRGVVRMDAMWLCAGCVAAPGIPSE